MKINFDRIEEVFPGMKLDNYEITDNKHIFTMSLKNESTEQQLRQDTDNLTQCDIPDFKIRVVENISPNSEELFGKPGSIVDVKNGEMFDKKGNCFHWRTFDKIIPVKDCVIHINALLKHTEAATVFELVEEQQPKPTTPKNPKNFKIRVVECVGELFLYRFGKNGTVYDVIDGEFIDFCDVIYDRQKYSPKDYIKKINYFCYHTEYMHVTFELVE